MRASGLISFGMLLWATQPAFAGEPRLLDTIGIYETEVAVDVEPSSKPTWTPKYKFIVQYDGFDQADVVLVQWKDGGKAIGKPNPCSAKQYVKETQVNPQKPMIPVHLAYYDCKHPKEAGIAKAGVFTLELVYKQTLADKKFPLGSLELNAIELKQGSQKKQTSTWTASHDHRLTGATIEEDVRSRSLEQDLGGVMLHQADVYKADGNSATHYMIRFWTKFKQGAAVRMTLSCLLDGKKMVETTNVPGAQPSYWTFKGNDKESGSWIQQDFRFLTSRVYQVPAEEENKAIFQWSKNPGDYKCVATAGGEVVKEVYFTIGADGAIVDSPCQAKVATLRHIHVIKSKDAGVANVPVDAKAGKKGYFGHVTWGAGCPGGPDK